MIVSCYWFSPRTKKKKKHIWFFVLPIMHGSHYKSIMKGSKISTKNDRQWMVLITNATCLFDPKLYMKGGSLWFRWGTKIFINNNNLIMKYHVGLCAIKLRDSYKCWSQMLWLSKKKKNYNNNSWPFCAHNNRWETCYRCNGWATTNTLHISKKEIKHA